MNKLEFLSNKKKMDIDDVYDFFIWDTARDNDGGAWRDSFRFNQLPQLEGGTSFIRTQFPSTVILIARSGFIEVHDGTRDLNNRHSPQSSLLTDIRGPFLIENENIRVSAAEGVIAITDGVSIFMIDLVDRKNYEIDDTGTYLVEGPNPFGDKWDTYEKTRIGGGIPSIVAITDIAASRHNHLFQERQGGHARPFIFAAAETTVIGIRPDLEIIEYFHTGWTVIDSLQCLPRGELAFRAGVDVENMKGHIFKPESWYFVLGTGQAEDHASVLLPVDAILSTGFDEFGIGDANGRLSVVDIAGKSGGSRVFHGKGCSPKLPGNIESLVCAIDAGTNVVPFSATAVTLTGILDDEVLRGVNFFSGWDTGNFLERDFELTDGWNRSWCVGGFIKRDIVSETVEYIAEFSYNPGGYSGAAARLVADSGVLKFEVSIDGWVNVQKSIDLGLVPTVPSYFACGVVTIAGSSHIFANMNGQHKSAIAASLPFNADSKLSIGLSRGGTGQAVSFSLSNIGVSFDFSISALHVLSENYETVKGQNSTLSLHGVSSRLIGGDDEFGVFGVLTDKNIVYFRNGVVTYEPLSVAGLLTDVTIVEANIRGWRTGIIYIDEFEAPDLWIAAGTISFDRSDYESMLGLRQKCENCFQFKVLLRETEDHIGPMLPVSNMGTGIFNIEAVAYNPVVNRQSVVSGRVSVERGDGTSATQINNIVNLEEPGAVVFVTAEEQAQGAYLLFDAPGLADDLSQLEWSVKITRSKI